jgi:hypothetical protein
MKKLLASILVTVLLIVFTVSAALAWNPVTGCVTDAYGAAWTHGGTATLTLSNGTTYSGGLATSGTTLGCFTIQLSGNDFKLGGTLAIILSSPAGDISLTALNLPAPTGNGEWHIPYNFAGISSGTGPTAVTLSALSAQGLPVTFGLILPVAGLAVAGGVVLRRSRRS